MTTTIELPPKLIDIFAFPRGSVRYRGAYGGRGSGKSFNFALMTAIFGYSESLRILCVREMQNSIRDSVKAEIENAINKFTWLSDFYEIGESFIRGKNGTEYIFKGLKQEYQMNAIKSTSNIDLCWVEEAESVSENSWKKLIPTIRSPKSEIWLTWNPESEDSPTKKRFIDNPPKNAIITKVNYNDNPFFPQVLEQERLADLARDPDYYAHVWEGEVIIRQDAQIFKRYEIKEFTPALDWDGAYVGLDFGFANDPTVCVKAWIYKNTLYVEYDCGQVGLELDDTCSYIKERIPNIENYTIYADSARPESISFLKRYGLPKIREVEKGKIEDGIEFIKKFDTIVIHPRCEWIQREMRLYSYKVDRLSGDILPVIVDANNHAIDALRYALSKAMKQKTYMEKFKEVMNAKSN
ncbi:MAG: PBSX family phage terminase large subunit [Campylobacteraceae bacterium]|jgi:phage terminase large subunit|nr:PBSX family phage terminase large subunit [Campylobacteraceae bacterium]